MKCLIANDEPMQLGILIHLFEQRDFEVSAARNGQEAIDIVV